MNENLHPEIPIEEVFKEKCEAWFDDILMYLEVDTQNPLPFPPRYYAAGDPEDGDIELNLTEDEKAQAEQFLMKKLDLDDEEKRKKSYRRAYETVSSDTPPAPSPGKIDVEVFKTNIDLESGENVFLQIMTFTDKKREYVLGPDMDI